MSAGKTAKAIFLLRQKQKKETMPFAFIGGAFGVFQMRKIAGEIISIAMEEVADCLAGD